MQEVNPIMISIQTGSATEPIQNHNSNPCKRDGVTRFSTSGFFSCISFPQAPEYTIRECRLEFFRKFAKIFAAQGAPPVANLPPESTTPAVPVAKFAAGAVDT